MRGITQPITVAEAKAIESRFWPKVQKTDGCWLWTGCRNWDGYGAMGGRNGRSNYRAHRISYILATGDETTLYLLHRCDNPACVRPDHLIPGTQRANMGDCARKGRTARGEKSAKAKLTAQIVKEIWLSGMSQPKLAVKYGVRAQTIRAVFTKRTWRHVTDGLGPRVPRKIEKPPIRPDSHIARIIAMQVGETQLFRTSRENSGSMARSVRDRGYDYRLKSHIHPEGFTFTRIS